MDILTEILNRKRVRTAANAFEFEVRKTYIGGTDAAAICGLSDWSTAFDVFLSKTAKEEIAPDETKAELFAWGHRLEPLIAEAYCERTGHEIMSENKFFEDKECEFFCANTDREMRDSETDEIYILECKTVASTAFTKWKNGVPLNYYTQAQWYLSITGYSRLVFAILVMDSRKLETFEVIKDEAFIEEIRDICRGFWVNCVLKNEIPDLELDDYAKIQVEPESSIAADVNEIILRGEIQSLQSEKKRIEAEIEEKINTVKTRMGDKALCVLDKEVLFTWKSQERTTVNTAKLKKEFPDVYEQVKQTSVSRTFNVK